MTQSTGSQGDGKPRKPKDFPLYPHPRKQWAKKVRGRTHYFGPWDDPEAALNEWLRVKDDLLAGREPPARGDTLTLKKLCFLFLDSKEGRLNAGELSQRTFDRYKDTAERICQILGGTRSPAGLRPADFKVVRERFAKRFGPIALGNEIQIVRSIFRYGYEAELMEKPVRFGPDFKKPSAKAVRVARNANGPRAFTREQIIALLNKATVNMRAMILLGINAGLGNTDVGALPMLKAELKSGWLMYPRPKTAIMRRIPLWPETIEAIQAAIKARKTPRNPNDAGLLFIGKRGQNYLGKHRGYRVTAEFVRVAKAAGVVGRAFYDLRRTFETIAGGSKDQVAVDAIMGHAPSSDDMAAIYRQAVEDERLIAVVNHVRRWLYPEA